MTRFVIHYFSGTGNTWKMINYLGDQLQKFYSVSYVNIETVSSAHSPNFEIFEAIHIFAFPIYCFSAPDIVYRYINSLPRFQEQKAIILCTCGQMAGGALGLISRILATKGLEISFTDFFIYPDNFTQIMNAPPEDACRNLIRKTEEKLDLTAQKILQSNIPSRKPLLLLTIFSAVIGPFFKFMGRILLGKMYIADNNCNECNLCKKLCPVQAIEIKNKKPKWDWKCEACQRCINICPQKSIQTSLFKLLLYLLIPLLLFAAAYKFSSLCGTKQYILFISAALLWIPLSFLTAYLAEQPENRLRSLYASSITKHFRRYSVKSYINKLLEIKTMGSNVQQNKRDSFVRKCAATHLENIIEKTTSHDIKKGAYNIEKDSIAEKKEAVMVKYRKRSRISIEQYLPVILQAEEMKKQQMVSEQEKEVQDKPHPS